jgi:RNA polymerase sigma factor (sigma-70 family)
MDDWPDFRWIDWEDLYPRLLLATEGRLRRIWWRGRPLPSASRGLQAEDFVQQAIESALTRRRTWDPTRNLFQNLWQIISSDISHTVESYENRNVDSQEDSPVINLRDFRQSPEDVAIYNDQVKSLLSFLEERDPDAKQVAALILSDVTKSMELALQLELSVKEIENIKKRLRRLCRLYREEHEFKQLVPSKMTSSCEGGE